MKVAVSATGRDLICQVDPRFGRCQYFILVDPETMEFEAFENEGSMAGGGAGIQATQFIAQKGAKALITGNLGPNAAAALAAAGIEVYLAPGGMVKDVIADYRTGSLPEAGEATVPLYAGMGRGRGRGRGMGGGRRGF